MLIVAHHVIYTQEKQGSNLELKNGYLLRNDRTDKYFDKTIT